MNKFSHVGIICGLLAGIGLLTGCSSGEEEASSAFIDGSISVPAGDIPIGDYSGIEVTIIQKDSAQSDADTLFYQVTDSTGYFSGTARFPTKRFYTLLIDRGVQRLVQGQLILADGDSVRIEGVLPDLQASLVIRSNEHNALEKYIRLTNGYRRVSAFIQAGALLGDSLTAEINKWGDLYWDLYLEEQGTLAADEAASDAVRLYRSINSGPVLMSRLAQLRSDQNLIYLAAQFGGEYLARNRGLDYSLGYLDTLRSLSTEDVAAMAVYKVLIELLYDSVRIDRARSELETLRGRYELNQSDRQWADKMGYDLDHLSPGNSIPRFSFQDDEGVVSSDSLIGSPYILEVTLLANQLYQNEFDRTSVIHNIYGNYGLRIVTIPLDTSQITIDAFFEERNRAWPVAPADAFEREDLVSRFNIRQVPTWFLVDRNGKIVRKYEGQEYRDIIQKLQTIISTEEPPS